MRPGRESLVDVVEVDGVAVLTRPPGGPGSAVTGEPQAETGGSDPADAYFSAGVVGALLSRWGWWRRARPGDRQIAGVTAAVLAIALAAGVTAAVHRRPVQTRVQRILLAAGPSGVDAAGCPLSRTCVIRTAPNFAAVVTRLAPQLPVVTSTEVYDVADGTVYRRQVLAQSRSKSATLWLNSQCLPTSAPARDQPQDAVWSYYTGADGIRYESVERTRVSLVSGCVAYARAAYPLIYDQLLDGLNSAMLGIIYNPQALAGS